MTPPDAFALGLVIGAAAGLFLGIALAAIAVTSPRMRDTRPTTRPPQAATPTQSARFRAWPRASRGEETIP